MLASERDVAVLFGRTLLAFGERLAQGESQHAACFRRFYHVGEIAMSADI